MSRSASYEFWEFINHPFKDDRYKGPCKYLVDTGVAFKCKVRLDYHIGDCTGCRLRRAKK